MANDDLGSRRALVTGGTSPLGCAIAQRLLSAGARVAIGDLRDQDLMEAARKLDSTNLFPIRLDVTSIDSVRSAVRTCAEKFGGLDVLVNCACIIGSAALDQISEVQWDRMIEVNLKGVFLCCQAALPFLRESGRARIVNISSHAGKKGYPFFSSYCAAKFGLIGFSRAIALELAAHGLTVNCVCPVEEELITTTDLPRETLTGRKRNAALKTAASKGHIVSAVMFFISEDARCLTGQAVDIGVVAGFPIAANGE